jgi:hypothetical protein
MSEETELTKAERDFERAGNRVAEIMSKSMRALKAGGFRLDPESIKDPLRSAIWADIERKNPE